MTVRKALLQTIAKIFKLLSADHLQALVAPTNSGQEGAGEPWAEASADHRNFETTGPKWQAPAPLTLPASVLLLQCPCGACWTRFRL